MDMVTINQVLTLLDNNKSIDTAVKDNMRELIILFNEKFANVSLNNLARILPNLSIIKSNKFVNRRIFKYNIICCIDKASEEKIKYQIGYAKLCERWYYSEERKYNIE